MATAGGTAQWNGQDWSQPADVDTSGDAVEQSFAKLLRIVTPLLGERRL